MAKWISYPLWSRLKELGIAKIKQRGSKGGIHRPKSYSQTGNIPTLVTSCRKDNKKVTEINTSNLIQILTVNEIIPDTVICKTKFGLLNARSLMNKMDVISEHIISNDLDICGFTETWLPSQDTSVAVPNGYSMLHIPRQNRRGGGVAVVHKSNIKADLVKQNAASSYESIEAILYVRSASVRVVVIYRPPSSPVPQFFEDFSDLLERLSVSSGKLMLTGDFNFHVDNPDDPQAKTFLEMLDSNNLIQHVKSPTHLNDHILDLIITRSEEDLVSETEVSSLISDHLFIHCSLALQKPPLPRKTVISRKRLTESHGNMICHHLCLSLPPLLMSLSWCCCTTVSSPDSWIYMLPSRPGLL